MTLIATLPSIVLDAETDAAIIQRMQTWHVGRVFKDPRGALEQATDALIAAETSDSEAAVAHGLLVASAAQVFLGNSDSAFDQLDRARALFRSVGDEWGDLTALLRMNVVWESRGQLKNAVRKFPTAIQRARDLDDPVLLIGFLNDLGLVQRENQEFDSGFDALREASQIAESVNDPFHVLLTRSNMVSALLLQHDYATAASNCRDWRDLLSFFPEYRGFERLIDFNDAQCATEFRDYPRAIALFVAAHEGSVTESDLYFPALSSFEEGRVRFLAEDRSGATAAFSRSLDEWNQISTTHRSAQSVMSQWWIESLSRAWTWRTVADLRDMLERPESESQEMCIRIFDALAESLEELGDFKAILGYLREVATMKESFWKGVAIGRSHLAA